MKKAVTIAGGFFIAFALLFGAWTLHISSSSPYTGTVQTDANTFKALSASVVPTELERLAHEYGATHAYDVLRAISATDTPTTIHDIRLHTLGHIIGNVLYEQQGLSGLVHCTSEFSYSCYHSLLSAEVTNRGVDEIETVLRECKVMFDEDGSCEHGMGHGFVAIAHYNIETALSYCEEVFGIQPVNNCAMGAYMEYNMHTMLEPGGSEYRELDSRGQHYPCTAVRAEFKNECYYFMPKWWFAQFGTDAYTTVGELCEQVPQQEQRDWCYLRIGLTIRELPNVSVPARSQLCLEMPSQNGQARCLQKIHEQFPEHDVCSLLPPQQYGACTTPLPLM